MVSVPASALTEPELASQAEAAPLNLARLLQAAQEANPLVLAGLSESIAASADLQAAQRAGWPTVSALAETSSRGQHSRGVRVEKKLWDAGAGDIRVRSSELALGAAGLRVARQRLDVGLAVVSAWASLHSAQGRETAARSALARLNEFRLMILRRLEAQVATGADLELVRSRIAQTHLELGEAQALRRIAYERLESLTGLPDLAQTQPPIADLGEPAELATLMTEVERTDWGTIVARNPAVLLAGEEIKLARERVKVKAAERWPQLYGALTPANVDRSPPAVFLGLRYAPAAGFAIGPEVKALTARAQAQEQAAVSAEIDVRLALANDRDELARARWRLRTMSSARSSSKAVLESYERQFAAGRRSWMDLLNAMRELTQNDYARVEAHAQMAGSLHRLQLRIQRPEAAP